MTEPNENATVWMRFDAAGNAMDSHEGEMVPRADFDRLRDERDEWEQAAGAEAHEVNRQRADIATLVAQRDEARRVAGVLADALRNNAPCYCDHPLRAGLPPCSRCSALAVFDTLTEEKHEGEGDNLTE